MAESLHVLHVDGESSAAGRVATGLEREDGRFDVVTAADVDAALAHLAAHAADCVVSHDDLPGTGGVGFLETVRETHPTLPFILYAADRSEAVAGDAVSAGVTDYVRWRPDGDRYDVLADRIAMAVTRDRAERTADDRVRTLSQIAESTDDVLYVMRGDWSELRFVNSSYEDIWGGSVAELEADPSSFLDAVHPADTDAVRQSMERLSNGTPDEVEYRVIRPDGEVRWVHGDSTPVLAEDGTVDRIVGFVRDITDRKERQERLEETVAQFEALFENSPDMILTHDIEGRILDANDRLATTLGYAKGALIGRRVWDVDETVTPEEAREFWAHLPIDEVRQFEGRYRPRAGDPFDVEVHLVRLEIDGVDRFLGIVHDISERKERERNLERYRNLVTAMEDPVCIYDEAGRYVLVNDHLARSYGTSPEALLGQPSRLVEQIRGTADGDPYQELLDGEREELKGEFESNLPGRDTMECRLTRLVIDGTCEGVVAVSRNISERRARERELERTNAQLEEFANVVSHDLRNPLTVAKGRVELAAEECDSDHLADVRAAHDRMETLIEDLLLLARDGTDVTDVAPVSLGPLTEASWRNVATAEATLVCETDLTIRADESRLRHLLENLIRNAVEHGGDAVTVTVGDLDDGFFVEDDGPGIPADRRDRVFDVGYSTTQAGTGLGLSIVREVAEAHDWSVSVTTGRGGGARFEVTGVGFDA